MNTWKVREWVQLSVGERRAHAKLHKVLSSKELVLDQPHPRRHSYCCKDTAVIK